MVEFVEDDKEVAMPTSSELSILSFYKWMVMLIPFGMMISHWVIFYNFSLNMQEVMKYPSINEPCIAWVSLTLVVLVLLWVPATYLYRRCSLFRIPFIYFVCVTLERLYYGSWFCTNEMIDTHYVLISYIIGMYVILLIKLGWKHRRSIKSLPFILTRIIKRLLERTSNDAKYKEVLYKMEGGMP